MVSKKKWREIVSGAPIAMPIYVEEYLYEALAKELEKEAENPTNEVIRYFVTEYEARFGRRPVVEGKETKRMKDAMRLSGFGPDRMKRLVLGYLEMKHASIVEQGHSLFVFLNNLDRIARMVETPVRVVEGPRTDKPTMEIHPRPVEPEPIVPPPPDVVEKLRSMKLNSMMNSMPEPAPRTDLEERKEQLKRQAEQLKKERGDG